MKPSAVIVSKTDRDGFMEVEGGPQTDRQTQDKHSTTHRQDTTQTDRMSGKTLISQAKFEFSGDKSINEVVAGLVEEEWEKVRVTLFHDAERRCLKSGLKLFKQGVEKQINTFGKEDVCIQYTPLNLTDYSPACDKTMDEYAAGVFKDEKIKKILEKNGLVAVSTGVREMFSRDTTTKEIKERVDVIYAVIITKRMAIRLMLMALHKPSAPAKSNAPSLD